MLIKISIPAILLLAGLLGFYPDALAAPTLPPTLSPCTLDIIPGETRGVGDDDHDGVDHAADIDKDGDGLIELCLMNVDECR